MPILLVDADNIMNRSRSSNNWSDTRQSSSVEALNRSIADLEARIQGLNARGRGSANKPQPAASETVMRQRLMEQENIARMRADTLRAEKLQARNGMQARYARNGTPASEHDYAGGRHYDAPNAGMREIAESLASLRNDLRRDVDEIKTMAGSGAMPTDIRSDLARLADQIESIDHSRNTGGMNTLHMELDELRNVVNELAREDSMRRLETRWDGFEERISDLDPAAIREEMITLSYRLDDIKSSIGQLPSALPLHALEDKIKMLVSAIDAMSRQPGAADPEIARQFSIMDDRLDEISRAIVASSVSQSQGIDNSVIARLEDRLDAVVDHIGNLGQSDQQSEMSLRLEALTSRVGELASQEAYGGLIERLDLLSQAVVQQSNTPDPLLISHIEELSRKVDTLDLEVVNGHLNEQLSDLSHRIDNISKDLTATNGNQDMLYGRLEDLADRVEHNVAQTNSVDFTPLEDQLAGIVARLDAQQVPNHSSEESIRSLEDQVTSLSQLLTDPAHLHDGAPDIEPRLAAIEDHLQTNRMDSQDMVIETARQAAEAAVLTFQQNGAPAADMATIETLVGDLRSLEALSRKSEERSTRTIDAVHDTLLKIASRLERLEDRPERAVDEQASVFAPPADDTGQVASAVYPQPAAASDDAINGGFVPEIGQQDVIEEKAEPGRSILSGLKEKLTGSRSGVTQAHREHALQTVHSAPSIDPVSEMDSQAANMPLEPGSGAPDIKRIMAKVREAQTMAAQDNAGSAGDDQGPADKADFIAAARRAARAAASEAAELDNADSADNKGSSLGKAIGSRRKPILLAAGAILLAVLSFPLVSGFINGDQSPTVSATLEQSSVVEEVIEPVVEPATQVTPNADEELPQVRVAETMSEEADVFEDNLQSAPTQMLSTQNEQQESSTFLTPEQIPDTQVASLTNEVEAPVAQIDLPPEAVGPLSLREAAADGDSLALFEVGARYTDGRGVPVDLSEAAKWYRLSAERGFAPAQYRIANFYEKGTGVERDVEKAMTWYQKAAEQGNASAMHNLAVLYAMGSDGVSDYDSAGDWFTRAADLGVKDSQFNLAILHARGTGVEQNLEDSYKWFAIAAKSGDKDATKKRDEVGNALRPEQLQSAKSKVAEWKPGALVETANSTIVPAQWRGDTTTTASVDMKKAIRNIQGILTQNGFDTGGADGIMGNRTISAIKAFQTSVGLEPTGEVDDALVKELIARNK